MNLRPKEREEPDINLTPLIDVVFLMLIFFMVSTTFEKESIVKVDLPKASTSEEAVDDDVVEVTINAKGEFFLNRTKVLNTESKTLKAAIIKIMDNDNRKPFVIRADANAPHQSVVTALDVAGQLGFSRVSIPTIQEQEE
jgi:biopolymer transport protein ExbD